MKKAIVRLRIFPELSTHDFFWTERRANRHAKEYFGKYYGVDWDAYHDTYWKWNEELKISIKTPYTIEDIYPTY